MVRRAGHVLAGAALSVAAMVAYLAAPTAARAASPSYYLALGDSLAHGVGAGAGLGYVCALTLMCTMNDIHANDAGHAVLAGAFEREIAKALAKH